MVATIEIDDRETGKATTTQRGRDHPVVAASAGVAIGDVGDVEVMSKSANDCGPAASTPVSNWRQTHALPISMRLQLAISRARHGPLIDRFPCALAIGIMGHERQHGEGR
ncbi:MAG: hypothetical protein Q8N44_11395 [Rubrivivax sp.]|nr:hypothetical protein [Rubrivivax sp.]MDP3084277.1 hypothetical protein [Rubrivivax sp.]